MINEQNNYFCSVGLLFQWCTTTMFCTD